VTVIKKSVSDKCTDQDDLPKCHGAGRHDFALHLLWLVWMDRLAIAFDRVILLLPIIDDCIVIRLFRWLGLILMRRTVKCPLALTLPTILRPQGIIPGQITAIKRL